MPKNRKLQNIIGTEHITDAAEAAIAAQASGGATVAFKNVAVAGQDNVVADAATDTLTLVGGSNVTITTDASADSVTIAAADTVRTVTAGGNTLAAGETLAFTEGTNITISESGGAVTITAAGGSSQISHTPQLAVPLFDAASSLVTVYPLIASGQSAKDTTSDTWNDNVSTTTLFLWPCIAADTGTINGLQLRTGASAGDDLHIALYKSDANGLPNGSTVFNTTISPATNTSYTPTISVSGVTKGDILYFATFGQSTRTNLRVIDVSDGGTFVVGRGVSSVNYSAGGNAQIIQLSGQTNGSFPTLSASTQYTGVGEPDFVPRIGITYS